MYFYIIDAEFYSESELIEKLGGYLEFNEAVFGGEAYFVEGVE